MNGRLIKWIVFSWVFIGLVSRLDAALVAHWKFDEGAGTTAADSIGGGGDGTLVGNPVWSSGMIGGGLWFSGTGGQYVRIANNPVNQLRSASTYSVALWVSVEKTELVANSGAGMILMHGEGCSAWGSWFLGVGGGEHDAARQEGNLVFGVRTSNGSGYTSVAAPLMPREWVLVTVTFDGQTLKMFINGKEVASTAAQQPYNNTNNFYIGGDPGCGGRNWFGGAIDDLRIYDHALTEPEIRAFLGRVGVASMPTPASGATDVPRDTGLSWKAGAYPGKHDVYLGTAMADVDAASRQDPKGVLVSKGQVANTYKPASMLGYGQRYYWRIDEVNDNDGYVHKGDIWSFTVETYGYPVTPVKATASSVYKATAALNTGPERTIDGSGLVGDQHSTTIGDMWVSKLNVTPIWIQYEFDKVYKLHELWVWNSNQAMESVIGYGAKDVEVLYSEDGQTWNSLGMFEFAQGPGESTYVADIKVDLGGVFARYVKLDIKSSWGGGNIASISEVRFFYVPLAAFRPDPADGAADVAIDATLNWRPGRQAAGHKLYLGTDKDAVSAGTVQPMTLQDHKVSLGAFTPMYATTYYWRVDEVNDQATPALVPGDVWSFKTIGYAVVDDFESYDDTCNRIYFAWIDRLGPGDHPECGVIGIAGNATGATVGNMNAPFAERTIVHSGRQSMPLEYDNSNSPYYSETTRQFATAQDWTTNGVNTLTIYMQGQAAAFLEIAPGSIVMNGTGNDIWDTADQFRFVYKQLSGDGSIVARVEAVGNTHQWAKAGVMIRETLDGGSRHAFVAVTPLNGVAFQRRLETGGTSTNTNQTGLFAPYWVRLTRKGNTFTGECSADGVNWTSVGPSAAGSMATINMANDVYIGLAVCSHDAALVCGAKFTDIATTGKVTGTWQVAEIGVSQAAGNEPGTSYVIVEDSSGRSKLVSNPASWMIATGAWERWDVPLSEFSAAGVNLKSIKKITIGIGDRNAPRQAGKGKLYIDDVALWRIAN